MRKRVWLPMILFFLLTGCSKGQDTKEDWLAPYREMTGCEMEARVICDQNGDHWQALLKVTYEPGGTCSVEVLEPETIAGVRAVLDSGSWYLEYEGHCLNAGVLSAEGLSPAECLPRMMDALGNGWLLEESREKLENESVYRVVVDQTGQQGSKIETTCWLNPENNTPLYGEMAVEGEIIFRAEFTQFAFYDNIK